MSKMKIQIIKLENEVTNTVLAIGFDIKKHRDKLLDILFTKICVAAGVKNTKLTFNKETGEVFINLEFVGMYVMDINGGKTVIEFEPLKCYRDEGDIDKYSSKKVKDKIIENHINTVRNEVLNGIPGDNPKTPQKLNNESIINKLKNES